jgi:hypothetical protein
MLKKTFTDYHPGTFNLENIDIEAYMRVVEQQELCAKYGSLLEGNDKNVLTIKNMPWFDLGDLPVSYKPKEVEAFQVVMRPPNSFPTFGVCKYNEFRAEFNQPKFLKNFHKMGFIQQGISQEEVEDSLRMAGNAMQPFHGLMAKQQRIKYYVFAGAFLLFVIFAMLSGLIPALKKGKRNGRWFWPLIIMVVYMVGIFVANHYFNKRMSYHYRMGHFVLSVLCRAENNRLYLKHGIEMRPGYNGLWVTFEVLPNQDLQAYVKDARLRFLKPAIEYRNKLFNEQISQAP